MTTEIEDVEVTIYDMSLEDIARPTINIPNYGEFELAVSDDYSIPVLKAINRMWEEMSDLAQKVTLTAKEGDTYEKNINALLKYACPTLSKEVLESPNFRRTHKSAIVSTFFIENLKRDLPMKKRPSEKDDPDSSLQDSIDSMAEALQT